MTEIGRLLIVIGGVLVVLGAILAMGVRLPFGRLPGDFSFGGPNFRVYIPLGTSILLSLVISLLLRLIFRR